ncbi:M48 family metallopeptidase [Stappia sediminis]|uniref:M48 family metallopeptidase n=1 Tax=Stappia sediminis TaxID=2692190 RepID=UPI0028A80D89|nr:SprT family zinc-dependent metalloprotease [Stappia sediminis]
MRKLFARKPEPLPDTFTLDIGGEEIPVRVTRNARAKRYLLRIPADSRGPVLTVPQNGTFETALEFAERHRGWLAEKLKQRPETTGLREGASIPLRGVEHTIVRTGRLRGLVEVTDGGENPEIRVPGAEEHLARKLTDWLKREARADLETAVDRHAQNIPKKPSGITVRDTTSRWGSCASNGRLSFSWRLVLAPADILDYVAAHEVAHLIEMNHGPRFWALCRRLAPHTDEARRWLKHNGSRLHHIG